MVSFLLSFLGNDKFNKIWQVVLVNLLRFGGVVRVVLLRCSIIIHQYKENVLKGGR